MPLNLLTNLPAPSPLHKLPGAVISGVYVHIPFCFHKCHYCDFYSITRQSPQRMGEFVDLLLREVEFWTDQPALKIAPETIFFGGGTPTLLPIEPMRRLLRELGNRLDLSRVNEWTVEANPATVTSEYCSMLRESGVNRLSFGAQSFRSDELATLERHHEPSDVPRSIELARAAGFQRLNVDMIYGIPGQDMQAWEESLEAAIALGTPHLSCYDLTYEPNTPIAVKKRMGLLRPIEEHVELQMFHRTRRRLRDVGLHAYEISNYAQPAEECRHNLLYWTGGNYLGIGPSAASHAAGHRFSNRPHLGEWEQAIHADSLPITNHEILSARQRAGELVMLMLRLMRPIAFSDFAARSGFDPRIIFADPIERFSRTGLLAIDDAQFSLTERGLEVADAVASEFLAVCQ